MAVDLFMPSKKQIMGIGDLAPMWRWAINFANPPQGLEPPDEFNILCTSAGPPKRADVEPIQVQLRGYQFERPGVYNDEHQIDLEFLETVTSPISLFIRDWRELMQDGETGERRQVVTGENETVLNMARLANDDNDIVIWEYELHGVWLRGYDPTGGPMGSDADSVKPTMSLNMDWFRDGPPGSLLPAA